MKCQISNEKGHPKKILYPLRTADDYLQVYSFIFGLCTVSIWDQLRPWQLVAVPKLKVVCAAFAVEILTQIGKVQSTAWKSNFGTLPQYLDVTCTVGMGLRVEKASGTNILFCRSL